MSESGSPGEYRALRIKKKLGVAFVTITHPPINVLDPPLIDELDRMQRELEESADVRVIVFQSGDPELFIMHADLTLFHPKSPALDKYYELLRRLRATRKVTIGKLAGRVRGAGTEFLLSLDMRFGALEKASLGSPEVAVGILPCHGGTQLTARLLGRARALEAVLGCGAFAADVAERYGYINRALPAEELDSFVDKLAIRIASFPPEAVRRAKAAVAAYEHSFDEGLGVEAAHFAHLVNAEESARSMKRFLDMGGQTREFELGRKLNW